MLQTETPGTFQNTFGESVVQGVIKKGFTYHQAYTSTVLRYLHW